MLDFIQGNVGSITIVIAVIAILLILLKLGKTSMVKSIVLSLVVQAEKSLGGGTGELKYAYVIDKIYDRLPKIMSFLFSKKEIDQMIEDSVLKLKKILVNGVTLDGIDDGVVYNKTYINRIGE